MFVHDKKKAAGIILSRMSPEGRDEPEEREEAYDLKIIAEQMMAAFKSGSVEDLTDALDALMEYDEAKDEEREAE